MTLRPYSADLQKTYRDTLGTPGAPEVIDDGAPVVPVAIVGGIISATLAASTNKTAVPLSASVSATSSTLGTVPTGKVWRIISAWVSGSINGADTDGNAFIRINGLDIIGCKIAAELAAAGCNSNSMLWDYTCCPIATAAQTVVLTADASCKGYGGVTYVETDA